MPWLSAQSAQWQAFQAQFSEANFLQSWQWGEVNERAGHVVIREVYLSSQANSVATVGWMGFVKNARRGRYLEVPGGPLLDWTDQVQVSEVLERIKKVARQHGCVFVRLRPQAESNKSIEASLSRCGARKAPMHLHAEHTNVMSLTPTEDELLAAMRRQTRYEIRRASKRGVRVEAVTANEAIDEFYTLQADTARRQGFVPPSKSFLAYQAAGFKKQLVLYRAYKDKQLLNAALVINDGREAVYHEAASTEAARREPGAYALVWQAICDAKRAGCSRFNFWGIAYSDDPQHRYAGVTTFKRGFGGQDITYVAAHDIVLRPVAYLKNWTIETIRKKKRKL